MKNWNWTPRGEFVLSLLGAVGMLAWFYTMIFCLTILVG